MKTLIIAEKPSVAADIASALGGFTKSSGFFERDDALVVGARGHLAKLKVPEGEDKGSAFTVLPLIPSRFDLAPIESSADVLDLVVKLMKRKDVSTVVNACDAGREGELIFRYIYQFAGISKPSKRMWLQSMTPDAIRSEFTRMRNGSDFDALRDAAVCRSEADWLIGINATRGVSRLFEMINFVRDLMSAGRVQTPVLAMVVEREGKIRSFVPRPYWEIVATFAAQAGEFKGTWIAPDFVKGADPDAREDRVLDVHAAQAIVQRCTGAPVTAVSETAEDERKAPPRLFDLTTLQREANDRFGFTAARTLELAQSLYETHKVLSYPRTDATALPEDYLETAQALFERLRDGALGEHAAKAIELGYVRLDKRIFNNAKISDHFAIIPTMQLPGALSDDEKRIYDLVCRRFIAAFYPPALFKKTVRLTRIGQDEFKSNGSVLADPGWMAVNGREANDDNALAQVASGELPAVREVIADGKHTKPPKRFTDATLLAAMEAAGQLVDDEALRDAMKEKGLGTPATRGATIEGLLASTNDKAPYLARDGKEIAPTEKGLTFIAFLHTHGLDYLCSPTLTGEWEHRLRLMEKGQFDRNQFMADVVAMTREIIERLKQQAAASPQVAAAKLAEPCRHCGGEVREEVLYFACGGCAFRAWKVMSKRRIARAEVSQLLANGKTGLLTNFVSTKGNAFSAHLVYNAAENKVDFEFPNSGIPCPDCGKPLIHHKKAAAGRRKGYSFFGCSGYPACTAAFEDARGKPGARREKKAATT
ncbi:DNA topoisomerase [Ralstonia thomasii]|uniref:DNA topoisomerase n=1 Tax=Ralstonia thomasii TaxID=3058596 RepID=UPI003C2E6C60